MSEFLAELRPEPASAQTRLEHARTAFQGEEFSRKDYLRQFPLLSSATGSRDLRAGVEAKLLKRTGTKALARFWLRNADLGITALMQGLESAVQFSRRTLSKGVQT